MKQIRGFSKYYIDREGTVYRRVKTSTNGRVYIYADDGSRHKFTVDRLIADYYDEFMPRYQRSIDRQLLRDYPELMVPSTANECEE